MISNVTILIAIAIVAIMTYGLRKSYNNAFGGKLDNDYKRWSEDELFIAAYIAIFVGDDIRLNDSFQRLLTRALRRSERAINEKIRRMSTIGAIKSDASEKDVNTIYDIAQMEEVEALEVFEAALSLVGASTRQQRAIIKYL